MVVTFQKNIRREPRRVRVGGDRQASSSPLICSCLWGSRIKPARTQTMNWIVVSRNIRTNIVLGCQKRLRVLMGQDNDSECLQGQNSWGRLARSWLTVLEFEELLREFAVLGDPSNPTLTMGVWGDFSAGESSLGYRRFTWTGFDLPTCIDPVSAWRAGLASTWLAALIFIYHVKGAVVFCWQWRSNWWGCRLRNCLQYSRILALSYWSSLGRDSLNQPRYGVHTVSLLGD